MCRRYGERYCVILHLKVHLYRSGMRNPFPIRSYDAFQPLPKYGEMKISCKNIISHIVTECLSLCEILHEALIRRVYESQQRQRILCQRIQLTHNNSRFSEQVHFRRNQKFNYKFYGHIVRELNLTLY